MTNIDASKTNEPKKNTAQPVPNLLPIRPSISDIQHPSTSGIQSASASGIQQQPTSYASSTDDEQSQFLRTQIGMNARAMEVIEKLRSEREVMQRQIEKDAKEREILKAKLTQMNNQLQQYKKKVDNVQSERVNKGQNQSDKIETEQIDKNQAEQDENVDPNGGRANDANTSTN